MLWDQKVLPEVRNRPLLPRDFFSHSTFRNSCKSSRGTFGFTHPMSDIHIRPGWSLRRFRNWRLVCSELRIRPDFQIYGSSIGVCNYVIQSNPIQFNPIQFQSNQTSQSINQIKSINQSINRIKSNQIKSINQSISQSFVIPTFLQTPTPNLPIKLSLVLSVYTI